jgi:hypothetical protein
MIVRKMPLPLAKSKLGNNVKLLEGQSSYGHQQMIFGRESGVVYRQL